MSGLFWPFKVLPEGTILISDAETDAGMKVYLALGMSDTIFSHFEIMGGSIEQLRLCKLRATLLPWRNKLVYDGIMMAFGGFLKKADAESMIPRLQKAYTDAVANNTIIRNVDFEHIKLVASVYDYLHVSTEDFSSARGARKAEDGGGGAAAAAGGGGGNSRSASNAKIATKDRDLARAIAKFPKSKYFKVVFRQFGYTAKENPGKLLCIMLQKYDADQDEFVGVLSANASKCIEMKKQHPQVREILKEMLSSKMLTKGKIPFEFLVDHLPTLDRLTFILDSVDSGVKLSYYPPPTLEESRMYRAGFDLDEEALFKMRSKEFGI